MCVLDVALDQCFLVIFVLFLTLPVGFCWLLRYSAELRLGSGFLIAFLPHSVASQCRSQLSLPVSRYSFNRYVTLRYARVLCFVMRYFPVARANVFLWLLFFLWGVLGYSTVCFSSVFLCVLC